MPPDTAAGAVDPDLCVHRWSYKLAKAPDPAPQVADAVIGACYRVIEGAAARQQN
jgi:hypothetical protein